MDTSLWHGTYSSTTLPLGLTEFMIHVEQRGIHYMYRCGNQLCKNCISYQLFKYSSTKIICTNHVMFCVYFGMLTVESSGQNVS